MEVHNGKKMNLKRIYSQIVKYGMTIPELAKEYGMVEKAFIERLKQGLNLKLFSDVQKANERNLKKQRCNNGAVSAEPATKPFKEKNVTKSPEKPKEETVKKAVVSSVNDMEALEKKKVTIAGEITSEKVKLGEATKILDDCEKDVAEKQSAYDSAREALKEAKSVRGKAEKTVTKHSQSIANLEVRLGEVEAQITELKNNVIYLVAPGYKGEKPEFGTYYSTSEVEGYDKLSIVEVSEEYVIEPKFKDMFLSGYDSLQDYMKALRFIMLCVEYTFKEISYTVLADDERLKKLLKTYID